MNKYQRFVISRIRGCLATDSIFNDNKPLIDFLDDEGNLVITQDENYNIKKRNLLLLADAIEHVEIDGKKINAVEDENKCKDHYVVVPFDFDARANQVTIYFTKNIADPLSLKVKFVEADHASFDAKEAENKRQNYITAANIKLATGVDLVNIYFQPVTDDYGHSIVELYLAKGDFERQHISSGVAYQLPPAKLLGGTVESLLGKFKVEEGMFFKAITGLANGVYGIKLTQFDTSNKVLFSSDVMFFVIR